MELSHAYDVYILVVVYYSSGENDRILDSVKMHFSSKLGKPTEQSRWVNLLCLLCIYYGGGMFILLVQN